ncbi:MAG TPA: ATP-binding protein [Gammaproteobacteria bacterium]|nr:ATP-binding protein [Gammaproteobacteria bacterium]
MQAGPINVLIVDDQRENRLALKAILSPPDYRVLEAGTEKEALRHLLREDCAVILLDVVMPDTDGFELAALIKERPRTAAVPIIFLTAEAIDTSLIRKGYAVGAADYLIKPLLPEVVRAKVGVFAQIYRQRKHIEQQTELLLEAERQEGDLRLMELRLAAERRYRALAEAVPHIVWTALPDGSVDYVNRRWFEYTGTPPKEGSGWLGAIHAEEVAAVERSWLAAVAAGEPFAAECRLRSSAGDYRWHLVRALPEHGASGEIVSWLGTFTDIDDQKRAENVLAEFKGMLDAVLDAVLIFDASDWRLLYANEGAGRLLRYSADELQALTPSRIVVGFDEERLSALVAAAGSATVEVFYRRKDGSEVPVELSLQRVGSDHSRIVAIARDITYRRQIEAEREFLYQKALEAVQARDEFLSIASHELRTPLTSLHLLIGALLRSADRNTAIWTKQGSEQLADKLRVADRQVGRLARLIDQLLDVSRISVGQFQVEAEEVDLAAAVRDVIDRFAADAAKADCEVRLQAPSPVLGHWDRMRIEQVLVNLFTNAIKFGEGKPVDIEVGSDGKTARLLIRDYGIGIAAEAQQRIFQRFERASCSREYKGLGLGLYIVQRIVDAHGGSIAVESAPGEGTAFTVLLPCRLDNDHRSALPLAETAAAGPPPFCF